MTPANPPEQPQPPAGGRHTYDRLRTVAGSGERFRFVSEPRRDAYLAILYALHHRRREHEMEVYHDDLRDECAELLAVHRDRDLDPQQFRSDVEQLRRWGNITERIEPTRIRSLSDRGRSKLLLRLDPGTAAFVQFLEGLADPVPLGLRDQGANLLADVHENLKAAARELRQAGDLACAQSAQSDQSDSSAPLQPRAGEEQAFESAVLRASHLIHEADAKTDRVAAELVEFEDRLTRFVLEPFRIRDVVGLGTWLERYLDRYLTVLDERGLAIRMVLGQLAGPNLAPLLQAADEVERRQLALAPALVAAPARLPSAGETVSGLRRFFDAHRGLAEICRRINGRTRDAIRRIQRHVEAVRLRNVRTEAIRARIDDLFALPAGACGDRPAVGFMNELIAAVGAASDGRPGTPEQRAAPPRPLRRYESARPEFRGSHLQEKRGTPAQRHELERLRMVRLSAFVEERILRGRPVARLGEARLETLEDSRTLVRALAAYFLGEGRHRRRLRYQLGREAPAVRVSIEAHDHSLEVPDVQVMRANGAPAAMARVADRATAWTMPAGEATP